MTENLGGILEKLKSNLENVRANAAKEKVDIVKLRLSCGWFQYLKVMNFFVSNSFIVPWRIVFNERESKYEVTYPGYQTGIWVGLHVLGLIVTRYRILDGMVYVRTSTDPFRYFNFGCLLGIYTYHWGCAAIWWWKRREFQEFVNELQISPLLKVAAPTAVWRTGLHTTMFLMYILPVYFYFCLTWGMVEWNWPDFYAALQTSAEEIFGIQKTWKELELYPTLLVFNLFVNLHNSLILHFHDMIAVSFGLLAYNMAYDFHEAIQSQRFLDDEVFEMIEAQKRITSKLNLAFGLVCCFYSLYCSPLYAMNIIDMFNLPGFMNRYGCIIYLLYLGLFLYWCTQINQMAKQRKRWLASRSRFQHISYRRLCLMLDDIRWERFGVGSFFVVNSTLSGEVVSLILTLAIFTIQIHQV